MTTNCRCTYIVTLIRYKEWMPWLRPLSPCTTALARGQGTRFQVPAAITWFMGIRFVYATILFVDFTGRYNPSDNSPVGRLVTSQVMSSRNLFTIHEQRCHYIVTKKKKIRNHNIRFSCIKVAAITSLTYRENWNFRSENPYIYFLKFRMSQIFTLQTWNNFFFIDK